MAGSGINQLQQRKDRRKSRTPPPPPKYAKPSAAAGVLEATIPAGRGSLEPATPAAMFPADNKTQPLVEGQNHVTVVKEVSALHSAKCITEQTAPLLLQFSGISNFDVDHTSPARRLVQAHLNPESDAHFAAQPWFRERGLDAAVNELLEVAAEMGPNGRRSVLELISMHGAKGDEALRRGCPEVLKPWIYSIIGMELGQGDSEWEEVKSWLEVEEIVRILEGRGAGDAYTAAWQRIARNVTFDFSELVNLILSTGHPEAEMLVQQISRVHGTDAARVYSLLYHLRLELGYSRIPVWRSVLLSADTSLEILNEVICILMGWSGGGDHMFEFGAQSENGPLGRAQLSLPEHLMRIDDVFDSTRRVGIAYNYANTWKVYIGLEGVGGKSEQGMDHPFCVEGVGFPEAHSAPHGHPANGFNLDVMNACLSRLSGNGSRI